MTPQKPFPYSIYFILGSTPRNPDKNPHNLLPPLFEREKVKRKKGKKREKKKGKKKKGKKKCVLQTYLPKDAAQRKSKANSHPPPTKTQITNVTSYFSSSENKNQTKTSLIRSPLLPNPAAQANKTSGSFTPNMFMTNLPFYLLKLRRKARRLFSSSKEPQSSTLVQVEVKRTENLS